MKNSSDNKQIPDRVWYYLLDWKESNLNEFLLHTNGKMQLKQLSFDEICNLFNIAVTSDLPKAFQL